MIDLKYVLLTLLVITVHSSVSAEVAQLTRGGGENYGSISPHFSPDGKKITYSSSKKGTYHIWTMDIDGKNQKEVTHLAWDMSPVWSPQGDIIAFSSYGRDIKKGRFAIWMVNLKNGKTWKFIKEHGVEGDQYPCWSPDGKSIVWTHGTQLWISTQKNPEKARPLTRVPAKAYEYCGGWSPDGKWIAYLAADTHDYSGGIPYKIWIIRPDGQDQRMVFNGVSANHLKWSENGKSLYFSNDKSIIKLDIESGVQKKVFDWYNSNNTFDISSDERWFIYDDNGADESGNIFTKPFSLTK